MIQALKEGYSIIVAVKMSVAKNGSPYATLKLRNSKVDVSVNVWGTPKPCPFKVGYLVQFTSVQEKDGFYSTKYESARTSVCPEGSPLLSYLQKVVTEAEWFKLCDDLEVEAGLNEKDMLFISRQFRTLYSIYQNKVAARSNHHNYPGGLLQHTYELLNIYHHIKPALPYKVNDFIVILGCLYHDFGKICEYTPDSELTSDFFLLGHPYIGARAVYQVLYNEGYSNDLIQHAQHTILSHHGYKEYGSPVVPSSPEAFTVHVCDLISGWGVEYANPQGTPISVFGESIQVQHFVSEE